MTDITINTKTHRNVESYELGKLEYVLGLAQAAVNNYKAAIRNYPPDRMEKYGKPHLNKLEENQKLIEGLILKKRR